MLKGLGEELLEVAEEVVEVAEEVAEVAEEEAEMVEEAGRTWLALIAIALRRSTSTQRSCSRHCHAQDTVAQQLYMGDTFPSNRAIDLWRNQRTHYGLLD